MSLLKKDLLPESILLPDLTGSDTSSTLISVAIRQQKTVVLRKLCKDYGIRCEGRLKMDYAMAVVEYSQRLVKGTASQTQGVQPQPQYMRRHKGPRSTSSPTKSPKRSSQRWAALAQHSASSSGPISKKSGQSSLLAWADALLETDKQEEASPEASNNISVSSKGLSSDLWPILPIHREQSQVDSAKRAVDVLLKYLENNSIVSDVVPTASEARIETEFPTPIPAASEVPQVTLSKAERTEVKLSVLLANNLRLEYFASDIVDPPPCVSISNVAFIASIWDDKSAFWVAKDCPLKLKGVKVAMIYWPYIFKSGRHNIPGGNNVWTSMKQNWQNCKYLAEEVKELKGMENFWTKWTNGTRCSPTTILKGLQEERATLNSALLETIEAKDPDFFQSAVYTRGRVQKQLTNPQALARRYNNQNKVS